tara:strand:+ start:3604 stop:5061 length:1458 start_codon:yes stop_codon:yes gene_type:complete
MVYLNLISSLFGAILIFGIVVFIHELGHYLAAKKCGVGVEEFAVGFGKCLFSFQSKETLWKINMIPLGGYVLIKGMVEDEDSEDEKANIDSEGKSFDEISLLKKVFILFAGPLANMILAFFIFFLVVFSYGDPKRLITIDEMIDDEFIVGLAPTGSIVSGVATESRLIEAIAWPSEKDFFSKVEEARLNSDRIRIDLDWIGQRLGPIYYEPQLGKSAISFRVEPQIDNVFLSEDVGRISVSRIGNLNLEEAPLTQSTFDLLLSEDVKIVMKDRAVFTVDRSDLIEHIDQNLSIKDIFSIDGMTSFEDLSAISSSQIEIYYQDLDGKKESLIVERSELLSLFSFMPKRTEVKGFDLFKISFSNTSFAAAQIFGFVGSIFRFEKKALENVGGPVAIISISSQVVKQGLENSLTFLALLSVNLGILNLLLIFIPNLDGGRIMIEIIENFVPVSKKQTVKKVTKSLLSIGGYALIILFLIITIRDIGRL